MDKVINPVILQLALERAAADMYQYAVVDPEMEDVIIGDGNEFATADDWMKDRIKTWIEAVVHKFKVFRQAPSFEVTEKTITTAHMFYKLKLGESINIHKDVVITRVPGGWVWRSASIPQPSAFIPYSDEFISIIQGDIS